ncbi:cupin domain-containing protein [Dokdonella sp.]|uniref:cupin domain-containing protein n=1 Tax=Dokdonella sp. TaxID=2291710 RepID=UPI001B112C13|nr:cupin domain-containing protein [Dokdonella sp.]MBO9661666.1 cupin domain-containing protein [Dokdonella sp.]
MRTIVPLGLLALLCSGAAAAAGPAAAAPAPTVTMLTTQELPEFPGKEAVMLLVDYPPGGADPVHRHDAHAFIYVLQGSIVMGVAGGTPVTLHAGQTFHEGPHDLHTIGRNASKDEPARFLAVLLKDKGKPALIPAE